MITPERIAEIYIVREVLEGAAARIAAERITDAEIVHLQKLLAEHEAQVIGKASETYRMGASDDDFHFFIIRCSGNQALIQLLCDEYYPLLRLFRQQHKHVRGRARRAFVEHHRIIEALADRDGELAETLMRKHISAALAGILSNLSSGIDVPESAEKEVL